MPSQIDTILLSIIIPLTMEVAHADSKFNLQTIDAGSMKTQEATPVPVTGPAGSLNLPTAPQVLPGGLPLKAPLTPTEQNILNHSRSKNQTPAQRKAEAQRNQNTLDMINGMSPGRDNESSVNPSERFPGMSQQIGPGIMENCGEPPASAKEAFETAKAFREKCSLANRGDSQKIAVNDYSGMRMPYMYIFDQSGKCLGKTSVSYGNGAGPVRPQPCNDDGSHLTPPGMFLTSEHNGASYNSNNSLGLTGLEGQGSRGRGVLIHPANAPGTASSWGCSGVGYEAFNAIKKSLGYGALVYNFFGNTTGPMSCSNKNGLKRTNFCRLDPGAVTIPSESTSQGSPSTR